MKKVIVRYPIPKKEELLERLKWLASPNQRIGSFEDVIKKYIRDRFRDLEKEELTILKSKKKIAKIEKCIKIGEDTLKDVMEKKDVII